MKDSRQVDDLLTDAEEHMNPLESVKFSVQKVLSGGAP